MYACVCMYACVYVSMYVCVYVCEYVCVYMYVYMCVYMCECVWGVIDVTHIYTLISSSVLLSSLSYDRVSPL
jgi:hypothetical protein